MADTTDVVHRVHVLMRGWAAAANCVPATPHQSGSVHALTHVLEELRGVVGDEGEGETL